MNNMITLYITVCSLILISVCVSLDVFMILRWMQFNRGIEHCDKMNWNRLLERLENNSWDWVKLPHGNELHLKRISDDHIIAGTYLSENAVKMGNYYRLTYIAYIRYRIWFKKMNKKLKT